jgi:hypothetical protein
LLRTLTAIVVVLHGLVHLLYFAQSRRFFELQPGMTWPDGSWAFSRLLGDETTRWLASIACVLVAAGFVIGGAASLARQDWWRPAVIGSALLSAALVILFWNGRMERLTDQGLIALLIDAAILVVLLVLQ